MPCACDPKTRPGPEEARRAKPRGDKQRGRGPVRAPWVSKRPRDLGQREGRVRTQLRGKGSGPGAGRRLDCRSPLSEPTNGLGLGRQIGRAPSVRTGRGQRGRGGKGSGRVAANETELKGQGRSNKGSSQKKRWRSEGVGVLEGRDGGTLDSCTASCPK